MLLLCAATGDWPYNFYIFLRIAVTGTLTVVLFRVYPRREIFWSVALGLIALIFNPIAPFHFSKDSWRLLNILAAITLGTLIAMSKTSTLKEPKRVMPVARVNCSECERLDAEFIAVRSRLRLAEAEGRPTKALAEKEIAVLGEIMSHRVEHSS